MASLDTKTDQEAEGILSGQLTFLKRTESEITRDWDGVGVGFWEEREELKQLLGNETQSQLDTGKQISEDHWEPTCN